MTVKDLIRQFLMAVTIACIFEIGSGAYRAARSESQRIAVEIPVYGQIHDGDLILQAESWVSNEIERQFNQQTDVSTVQVVVTANRNGEVIPVLVTTVSRMQWQQNPQVNAWTQYYRNSYALFQRHDRTETVTVAASPVGNAVRRTPAQIAQIDRAFDEGRLNGSAAQTYLSDLD
ncbi:hypothetical protein H6G20_10435 [Desertifilum sp. FACHB-1129]|uniref:Uncharacterized protein n=1 Tax=Desertifilum tharense IPPAS B-1220 TaxID=1781255 RepID=A0A1E5QDC6_9CYAN|nr:MULTISPECIES: hypothetical protein [Desertifilum]MDA0210844.1 hypothetical protein [Cyanobacteria bacterium FC1]MBD2312077.1 hypothetical protein [Desertifilum sp. FACHB-1129]MBD2322262.1 hypothetical protein [Desertifilum sp. FACHB-866]MBD2332299.1 hypothetical protein [Desertifilum sp. FACHB-868]OEJ72343.1 hypothetical protein BH720_25015 [Desertifilum tharense IPPAS B-1220]